MANLTKLTVPIGANLAGLRSGLKNAGKLISSFGDGVESRLGSVSIGNLDRQLQNIGQSSLKAVPSANKLASSLKNVQSPAKNTTSAVINFNRVIQDAPFGIIGVANNIEPLVTSFQSLQEQTGSTTGALKTLLTSAFTGPGALITAVSIGGALLTGLSMFGDRLFDSGEAAEKTERQLSGLNNEIDVMVKAIDRLSEFDDPFGIASLENELAAIGSKEATLKTIRDRISELRSEAENIREGGGAALQISSVDTKRARELTQEADELAQKYGSITVLNEKIEELEDRKLKTQQELNTSQDALNSGLVKEAEARAELLEQAKQRAAVSEEDIVPADLPTIDELLQFDRSSIAFTKLKDNVTLATNTLSTGLQNAKVESLSLAEAVGPLNDNISQTGDLGSFVGQQLGQAFAQAALFADDLGESIQNIGKQLLSKGIMNFFTTILSGTPTGFFASKGILGGIFHSGGVVPGNMTQERLVLAKGGETIRTPSQESTLRGRGGVIHITGEFRQRGSDLVAVINRANEGTLR